MIVKALASLACLNRQQLADGFGLARTQAVSNKYVRDSWSAQDLVRIADVAGYRLAFINANGQPVLIFPSADVES